MPLPPSSSSSPIFTACVAYDSPYVQPIILSALQSLFPAPTCSLLPSPTSPASISSSSLPCLHIAPYELLHHELLLAARHAYFANAHTYRKALIRKHHLPLTVTHYAAKHPDDLLRRHVPLTLELEVDYAEFLDDALVEAWELKESWARGAGKHAAEREWWILKPAMSDQGKGVRLFSSEEELTAIFEEWEEGEEDDEEEDDGDDGGEPPENSAPPEDPVPSEPAQANGLFSAGDGIRTSHLRHFVVQPYIAPLLLDGCGRRKFHLRSYVLALGALKVSVYGEMLALFAGAAYAAPGHASAPGEDVSLPPQVDMAPHLTNTCLQGEGAPDDAVRLLSELPLAAMPAAAAVPSSVVSSAAVPPAGWSNEGPSAPALSADALRSTICAATASLFRAAAAQPTHFQPRPNAFEIFGVDWLVDEAGRPWLLEVNAFPDFAMSGDQGRGVVEGVWEGALRRAGAELLDVRAGNGVVEDGWIEVLDLDLGMG